MATRVTIDTSALGVPWLPNTEYRLQLNEGFVTDTKYGIPSPADNNLKTFTTNNNPIVTNSNPADNAIDVVNNTFIDIIFERNIYEGTGNIELYKNTNTLVATFAIGDCTISGNTVSLDTTGYMESSTDYYVLLDSGIVEDADNFAFQGITDPTAINFTTANSILFPELNSDQVCNTDIICNQLYWLSYIKGDVHNHILQQDYNVFDAANLTTGHTESTAIAPSNSIDWNKDGTLFAYAEHNLAGGSNNIQINVRQFTYNVNSPYFQQSNLDSYSFSSTTKEIIDLKWDPTDSHIGYIIKDGSTYSLEILDWNGSTLTFNTTLLSTSAFEICEFDWSPDGTNIAVGIPNLRIWSVSGGIFTNTTNLSTVFGTSVRYNPEGTLIALGATANTPNPDVAIGIFDISTSSIVETFLSVSGSDIIKSIDWNVNNQIAFTISAFTDYLYLLDYNPSTQTLTSLDNISGSSSWQTVEFNPTGEYLAVVTDFVSTNSNLIIYDLTNNDLQTIDQTISLTSLDKNCVTWFKN